METRVKEGRTALAITLFLVATLTVPAVLLGNPASEAQQGQPSPSGTGPAIQLLNPSRYSTFTFNNTVPTPMTVQGPLMSDKDTSDADATPEYHFAAVIANMPQQPFVEFWMIQGNTQVNLGCAGTSFAGGSCAGTFGQYGAVGLVRDIPQDFTEGPPPNDNPTAESGRAVVRAILFSNNGQNEVSRDNQDVVINQNDRTGDPRGAEDPELAAETVEILYPPHGGDFGLFRPASGGAVGILDVEWSAGTDSVRVFYTVSPPDADPTWKSCSTDESTGASATAATAQDGVRCTLVDGDQPAAVTGVAAVARDTETRPPNQAQQVFDQSGDAHRVVGYSQVPGSIVFTPQTQALPASRVNNGCSDLQIVQVRDSSFQRPIAGVNVDVHAQGPSDQLAFNTHSGEQSAFNQNNPDRSQAPQNHPQETGRRCSDNTRSGNQGVHGVGGADDRKHIESADNSDDRGQFMFKLWSDQEGGTQVTAWADVVDDDRFCPDETAGNMVITWGSTANDPAPPAEGSEPPPCPNPSSPSSPSTVSPTASPTPTPSPSPTSPSPSQSPTGSSPSASQSTPTATPTPSPTPPPTAGTTTPSQAERDVSLEASESRKTFGKTFTLSGTVSSSNSACISGVNVDILRDVVGGASEFVPFEQEGTSSSGTFSLNVRADVSANYVAQVDDTTTCGEAASSPQPVLVRVKVILRTSDGKVRRGQRVRLTVLTRPCPATAGDRVLLFRAIEGEFGKSGKKRSNDACRATFRRRMQQSSVFQGRWPKQTPEFIAGKSRSKAVRVTR